MASVVRNVPDQLRWLLGAIAGGGLLLSEQPEAPSTRTRPAVTRREGLGFKGIGEQLPLSLQGASHESSIVVADSSRDSPRRLFR